MIAEHGPVRKMDKAHCAAKDMGYSLVELLVVIAVIGILAGFALIASGPGSDRAEAAKIASGMETMKMALLNQSQKSISRTTDPLASLDGKNFTEVLNLIRSDVDGGDFDPKFYSGLTVARDSANSPFFLNLPLAAIDKGIGDNLKKMASGSSVFTYDSATNSIRLRIK
jgi:prepilin-type N-terminal cleavage/methylation domain-containing protein